MQKVIYDINSYSQHSSFQGRSRQGEGCSDNNNNQLFIRHLRLDLLLILIPKTLGTNGLLQKP